jgi:DNA polymerase-3 subunit epsilon
MSASWRAADYVSIDIETTGLDPRNDKVIAFGAVPVRGGRIIAGEPTYLLFDPECPISPEATKVHGIHLRDLEGAPRLEERLGEISELFEGHIAIAHAAWVERRFLFDRLKSAGFPVPAVVDTAILARAVLPDDGLDGHEFALEYASTALGLPPHTPHHALGDAMTTAQLFLALASKMPGGEPTLGDMLPHRRKPLGWLQGNREV